MKEIFEKINEAKKILLLTHVNPDGDTLGSAVAMKKFIGEKADILLQVKKESGVPYNYKFLFEDFDPIFPCELQKMYEENNDVYDLLIALDTASIDRIVDFQREVFNKSRNRINIDHHKTNKGYAEINLIKGGYSSTGEVLYDLFKESGVEITAACAVGLYTAILTDTGCFKYENVTGNTFQAACELSTIVNTSEIAKKCYDNKPMNMVLFQAEVVSKAKVVFGGRVIYAIIKDFLMDEYNVTNEHTEGIAETLRSISSVDVSIVFKENKDRVTKVSLRSKTIDLTRVVEKFNGGGHKMAAGCTIKKPAHVAAELVLDEIAKCLKS